MLTDHPDKVADFEDKINIGIYEQRRLALDSDDKAFCLAANIRSDDGIIRQRRLFLNGNGATQKYRRAFVAIYFLIKNIVAKRKHSVVGISQSPLDDALAFHRDFEKAQLLIRRHD